MSESGISSVSVVRHRWFGTDGIRGPVGQGLLTPDGAFLLGGALAQWVRQGSFSTPDGRDLGGVINDRFRDVLLGMASVPQSDGPWAARQQQETFFAGAEAVDSGGPCAHPHPKEKRDCDEGAASRFAERDTAIQEQPGHAGLSSVQVPSRGRCAMPETKYHDGCSGGVYAEFCGPSGENIHGGRFAGVTVALDRGLRVLIGRDTRVSGAVLYENLARGLTAGGVEVVDAGVVPTPAVSYLVRQFACDLGIMISASHNPFFDNGFKIFSSKGTKLTPEDQAHIEEILGVLMATEGANVLFGSTLFADEGAALAAMGGSVPNRHALDEKQGGEQHPVDCEQAQQGPFSGGEISCDGPAIVEMNATACQAIDAIVDEPFSRMAMGHVDMLERGGAQDRLVQQYQDFLVNAVRQLPWMKSQGVQSPLLAGLRVGIDGAHGALAELAPRVFRTCGATVCTMIGTDPTGTNINQDVGAVHPETLAAQVMAHEADIGFAFDGDGDRIIVVDHRGCIHDGDQIVGVLAQAFFEGGVVGTVTSNSGLQALVARQGRPFVRTPVGDRHIALCLDSQGWIVGGEASGHVVLHHLLPTGDGLLVALVLASLMVHGHAVMARSAQRRDLVLGPSPVSYALGPMSLQHEQDPLNQSSPHVSESGPVQDVLELQVSETNHDEKLCRLFPAFVPMPCVTDQVCLRHALDIVRSRRAVPEAAANTDVAQVRSASLVAEQRSGEGASQGHRPVGYLPFSTQGASGLGASISAVSAEPAPAAILQESHGRGGQGLPSRTESALKFGQPKADWDAAHLVESSQVQAIIAKWQDRLSVDAGRILVRPSGTEPVVRILAEGPDQSVLNHAVQDIRRELLAILAAVVPPLC